MQMTGRTLTCPNGHLNSGDQHFCGECGVPLTGNVRCHHCQHAQTVPLNQQEFVCEQCGTTLKRLAPRRADDAHPAEAAPVPADDARSNRAGAWWKRRSLVHKAFIVLGIVIAGVVAWHLLASHNSARREADLSSQVKSSMQQNFDTDPRFTKYHLVVSKVDVLKQNGNQYQGMAIVHGSKGIDHEVPIDITAEGDKIIWHSEPGAFVWTVLEQLNPSAWPTPGSSAAS